MKCQHTLTIVRNFGRPTEHIQCLDCWMLSHTGKVWLNQLKIWNGHYEETFERQQ